MGLLEDFKPVQRTGEGSYLKQQFPSVYGALAGLLGTAPDEMVGTVLDPNTLAAKKAAEYTYLPGLLAGALPVGKGAGALAGLAGITKATKGDETLLALLNSKKLIDAERAAKIEAMGMERGWYRGGPQIVDGKKSGNWYTPFEQDAKDYAARTPNADVREYAVPNKSILKPNIGYPPRLASDIAQTVEGMGEGGAYLANLLRKEYSAGDRISGLEAWRGLEKNLGEDTAVEVLGKLGFKGAIGTKRPQDLRVFPSTPVRDANKAAFDPSRAHIDDIYGKSSLPMLGLLAAGSAGAAMAAPRMLGDE